MAGGSRKCRPFVGRRAEFADLEKARKALAQSSGSFVLVSGEAGIGKSRLLAEFLTRVSEGRRRHIVTAECLANAQRPFGPIREFIAALAPLVDFSDVPFQVRRALSQIAPDAVPTLPAPTSSAALEKHEIFAATFAFLQMVCAKRATILAVEDLHWADDSTLQALEYLAHRLRPLRLLLIATYRSDELNTNDRLMLSLSAILREATVRSIALHPMEPADLRQVISGALDREDIVAPDAVARIVSRSEGNPFFAEELVKSTVGRGRSLDVSDSVPLSIRATILARVRTLSNQEQSVLTHGAVLGQRFDPAVLGRVMNQSASDFSAALAKARDLNLLVDEPYGRMTCRFRHALVRETVYNEIPVFQRRLLHAQILAILEQLRDVDKHTEELAYHALEAEDWERACTYNESAGEAAFGMRALPEALLCFERALKVPTLTESQRLRILDRIGAIESLNGNYERSSNVFAEALSLALKDSAFDASAEIMRKLVAQRYNAGDKEALALGDRFLTQYSEKLSPEARDPLLVTCARTASANFDLEAATRYMDAVANPGKLPPVVRQNYLIVQLMRHAFNGEIAGWQSAARDAAALLPLLSQQYVVNLENALALTGIYIGQNDWVERSLSRADLIEREWTLRGPRTYNRAVKAVYLFQRGKLSDARLCIDEVGTQSDVWPAVLTAAPTSAYVSLALGDDSIWERLGGRTVDRAHQQLWDPDAVLLLASYAAVLWARGSFAQAQAEMRRAVSALRFPAPEAMYLLIDAARMLNEGELLKVFDFAERSAGSGNEAGRANNAFINAIRFSRFGSPNDAVRLAQQAAETYASLGWPLLEARALETAGKTNRAQAIYEKCGAVADVGRLAEPSLSPIHRSGGLSSREAEIAALVAQGLANVEIGQELHIGRKTVEKHISSIFDKLGVRSRSQIVAVLAKQASGRAPVRQA